MIIKGEKAREQVRSAASALKELFTDKVKGEISAQYITLTGKATVAGVCGLDFESPFISVFLQMPCLYPVLAKCFEEGRKW